MSRRRWFEHRQAYAPRVRTSYPASLLIVVAIAWVLSPPFWALVLISACVGAAGTQVHWWIWRRRHPVVPPEVVARRGAMWN